VVKAAHHFFITICVASGSGEMEVVMCFRPPELSKLMTQCPACKTFNPPKNTKCKKCGADLPAKPDKK